MTREFKYFIEKTDNDKTILQFLQEHGYSHSVIVHLKKTSESILKNGQWSYVKDVLHTDDVLEIKIIETESSDKIVPVNLPIDIVYEDEDILVINKQADTPIHPSLHNYENTLANGVMYYYQRQGISYTFRCITRLDRDTTGLTLLAKNMLSAGVLSVAMQNRMIDKHYLAICEGTLPGSGTITAPIARARESAIERCVDYELGEEAVTHYTALSHQNDVTLVELKLETGRTHQIRVHMAHLGHPLIGDFLYNPSNQLMSRQALHCHRLAFQHPVTGQNMEFTAPLPEDMQQILSNKKA